MHSSLQETSLIMEIHRQQPAQTVYYEFLADATHLCPNMQIIITAGNHDSASRLEVPRPLLARCHVEIRGNVRKIWQQGENEDGLINQAGTLALFLRRSHHPCVQ